MSQVIHRARRELKVSSRFYIIDGRRQSESAYSDEKRLSPVMKSVLDYLVLGADVGAGTGTF